MPRPTWFDLKMTGGKIENSTQLSIVRQKATQVLDNLIDRSSQVVLLDFPNHGNIGDSLIWLGTLEYLKLRRVRIVHAADFGTYRTGEVKKHVGSGSDGTFSRWGQFRRSLADVPQRAVKADRRVAQRPRHRPAANDLLPG